MRRLLALTLLSVLALAGVARADYHDVIADCAAHGQLIHHYSRHDLRAALSHLPADVDEYTDCRSIINNALTNGGRGFRGFTNGQPAPGANPLANATPAERAAVSRAQAGGNRPIHLTDANGRDNGVVIHPGQRRTSATITDVPAPLLVAAILLAAATLAVAASRLVRRVIARRHH